MERVSDKQILAVMQVFANRDLVDLLQSRGVAPELMLRILSQAMSDSPLRAKTGAGGA